MSWSSTSSSLISEHDEYVDHFYDSDIDDSDVPQHELRLNEGQQAVDEQAASGGNNVHGNNNRDAFKPRMVSLLVLLVAMI